MTGARCSDVRAQRRCCRGRRWGSVDLRPEGFHCLFHVLYLRRQPLVVCVEREDSALASYSVCIDARAVS